MSYPKKPISLEEWKRRTNSFEEWKQRTKSDDNLDRVEAAENFPVSEDRHQVAGVLVSMLDDIDELVRTEAAEQLAYFRLEFVREAIWRRFGIEQSDLVRGYLVRSIGEVGDLRDLQTLLSLSELSQPVRIRFNALSSLQLLITRHVTQNLGALVKAYPDEAGSMVTSLMNYLQISWLQNVEEFVDDTKSWLIKITIFGRRDMLNCRRF